MDTVLCACTPQTKQMYRFHWEAQSWELTDPAPAHTSPATLLPALSPLATMSNVSESSAVTSQNLWFQDQCPQPSPKPMNIQAPYLFDSQAWWHVPGVSRIARVLEFSTGLDNRGSPCLKENQNWQKLRMAYNAHTLCTLEILPRFLAMANTMYMLCK